MRVIRLALLAATAATLFLLARPASAECPPEDPACRLSPAESVEVSDDPAWARGTLDLVPEPGSLTTVPIPDFFVAAAPLAALAPAIHTLDVPLRLQDPSDVSCGVQALGMALAGLEGAAPASSALLGQLQGSGMMYDFGTGVEELAYAAQTFGYRGSLAFHGGDLSKLRAELEAGRPVVVALGVNGDAAPGHFVTVTGISADGEWVAYSDPTFGERVVPIGEFLAQWGAQGNSGVLVAHEPPSSPAGALDLFPWVAFAAALMALVSTTPLVTWRKGIGGAADAGGASGGAVKSSSKATSTAKKSTTTSSSSSSNKSSKTSKSSKSSSAAKAAPTTSAAVVMTDPMAESNAFKASAAANTGKAGSTSSGTSSASGSAGPSLDKVRDVQVGASSAPVVIDDPMAEAKAIKGLSASSSPDDASAATSAAPAAGTLEAKLAKVEEVEVMGSAATAPLVMDDPEKEHWDVVGNPCQLKPEVRGATQEPAATSGLSTPDWVRFGWRPPWVSSQDWYHMTPEDRQTTWADEAARLTALVDQVSLVLEAASRLDGRPPSISLDLWRRLSMEERHALTADAVCCLSAVSGEIAAALSAGPQGQELVRSWLQWLELPITQMGSMTVDQAWETYTSQYRKEVVLEPSIHVRSEAGGEHVGYLCGGAVVAWTGEVSFVVNPDGTRTEWHEITYTDVFGKPIRGWVRADYLFEVMPVAPQFDPHALGSGAPNGLLPPAGGLPSGAPIDSGLFHQYVPLGRAVTRAIEEILGVPVPPRAYQTNLCAFFALAAVLGQELNDLLLDSLTRLRGAERVALARALAADESTSSSVWLPILELNGVDTRAHSGRVSPSALAEELQGEAVLLALTGVDATCAGGLAPGGAGHWFVVEDVIAAGVDGWVVGYNPLTGCRETYTWSEFEPAWGTPSRGNNSHHTGIVAEVR